jgi:hypothetical protein
MIARGTASLTWAVQAPARAVAVAAAAATAAAAAAAAAAMLQLLENACAPRCRAVFWWRGGVVGSKSFRNKYRIRQQNLVQSSSWLKAST